MNNIPVNLKSVQRRIKEACERTCRSIEEVNLVVATKGVTPEMIITAFDLGIRNFGENSVQEAQYKMAELAGIRHQIVWHMIGHLQSNKARIAAKLFDIIHSVDSIRIAEILDRRSELVLPVLMQVNVARETTKSGFNPAEVEEAFIKIKDLSNLNVVGLMTIPPIYEDPKQARPVFRELRKLRDLLGLEHLSMGMSDDFEVAIEEGATIIRIGRAIFGERRS